MKNKKNSKIKPPKNLIKKERKDSVSAGVYYYLGGGLITKLCLTLVTP